jgi:NAD-dependent dihydropyrimidine dehydrogenase PreA subunit
MAITLTKDKCINCGGIKRICPFSMNKWRGKKNTLTGFFVAHIEDNKECGCTLYAGFV